MKIRVAAAVFYVLFVSWLAGGYLWYHYHSTGAAVAWFVGALTMPQVTVKNRPETIEEILARGEKP